MVIQGLIMTFALERFAPQSVKIRDGLVVSLVFGLFLASYIAIVEPSKYEVPSIGTWFVVEGVASLVQFSVFGIILGLIHRRLSHTGDR